MGNYLYTVQPIYCFIFLYLKIVGLIKLNQNDQVRGDNADKLQVNKTKLVLKTDYKYQAKTLAQRGDSFLIY